MRQRPVRLRARWYLREYLDRLGPVLDLQERPAPLLHLLICISVRVLSGLADTRRRVLVHDVHLVAHLLLIPGELRLLVGRRHPLLEVVLVRDHSLLLALRYEGVLLYLLLLRLDRHGVRLAKNGIRVRLVRRRRVRRPALRVRLGHELLHVRLILVDDYSGLRLIPRASLWLIIPLLLPTGMLRKRNYLFAWSLALLLGR